MKVLCVNHTGTISGAEHSLLDLMAGLRDDVQVRLACPKASPLAAAAESLGIPVDHIPEIDGSLKLHPRGTSVALGLMGLAAARSAYYAQRMHADVMHANSIRAGVITIPAARATATPSVVHLRDRLPRSIVADGTVRFIAAGAAVIAANSSFTGAGLRAVSPRGKLRVVYNPVDLTRFDPAHVDRKAARSTLGLRDDAFVIAVVGQITPWKGQFEAVQILAGLHAMGYAADLLLVGEAKFVSNATRHDNLKYLRKITDLVQTAEVGDSVHMLGERSDIPEVMSASDVLLVPSWEEPFGRVVVEAMALGVPVIATSIGGPNEIISDGVDGILLAPRDPEGWIEAIARLIESPALRSNLGQHGARRARGFDSLKHVANVRALYDEAIGG